MEILKKMKEVKVFISVRHDNIIYWILKLRFMNLAFPVKVNFYFLSSIVGVLNLNTSLDRFSFYSAYINMDSFLISQESGHPIEKDFAFNNNVANAHVTVRLRFLRKVYGILFTQLLLTSLCAGTMMMLKPVLLDNLQQNIWLPIVLIVSTIGILLGLMWKRQETPTNFILLYLFTICESILVGYAVITYSATVVLQAFILTTIVVMSLMLYTLNSKKDFSKWGVGLSVAFLILLLVGPINLFLGSSLLELCMAAGGACLFSLFIVYDTWRIMHHCSPEEYIMACVDLYLDILNLFMYILRFLKEVQHNQG